MRIFVLIVVAAALIISVLIGMGEINRAGIFGSGGSITSGSKFGVTVGIARASAGDRLEALGLVEGRPSVPGRCLGRLVEDGEIVDLWEDLSWRSGVICVTSRHGVVTRLTWSFGAWQL